MKGFFVLFVVTFLMSSLLFEEGECWRRRRRRRQCGAVNCQVSAWSSWSSCSHPCGSEGKQFRTRHKTVTESCGGSCSYSLRETVSCNYGCGPWGTFNHNGGCTCLSGYTGQCCDTCKPIDCQVTKWSSWSICSHPCGTEGRKYRTRSKTVTQSCGGSCSYSLRETASCNYGCGSWGTLNHNGGCTCQSGYTGQCCETCIPIHCKVSKWSSWSICSHFCGSKGTKFRARDKTVTESCGGSCSYPLEETIRCNYGCGPWGTLNHYGGCTCKTGFTGECCEVRGCEPTDCAVSKWSSWTGCSHPCGTKGTKHRTRQKTVKESCGGVCSTSLEEVVECNYGCGHGGALSYHGGCVCKSGFIGICCDIESPPHQDGTMGGVVAGMGTGLSVLLIAGGIYIYYKFHN